MKKYLSNALLLLSFLSSSQLAMGESATDKKACSDYEKGQDCQNSVCRDLQETLCKECESEKKVYIEESRYSWADLEYYSNPLISSHSMPWPTGYCTIEYSCNEGRPSLLKAYYGYFNRPILDNTFLVDSIL